MSLELIIYSRSEMSFWSNENGWVKRADKATRFTKEEAKKASLPGTQGQDAAWIGYDDRYIIDDLGDVHLELTDEEALHAAREQYQRDGEIEVDIPSDPKLRKESTSRGGDDVMGCYVKAWVWVYWPGVEIDDVEVDLKEPTVPGILENRELTTAKMDAVAALEKAMKDCFWAGVDPADSMQEMYKRVEADVEAEKKSEDGREDGPLP